MTEPDEPRSDLEPGGLATIRSADAVGVDDDPRFAVLPRRNVDPTVLALRLGVEPLAADAVQHFTSTQIEELLTARPQLRAQLKKVYERTYDTGEFPLHIIDVRPVVPPRSQTPFTLAVQYQNVADLPVVLMTVRVRGVGRSSLVERTVDDAGPGGVLEVDFDGENTPPEGPAVFEVSLFRSDGARSDFRRTMHVLPQTAALTLGRFGSALTRSAYRSSADAFVVECDLTVANGSDGPLTLKRAFRWRLRDESGELLESGVAAWPTDVTIPPLSILTTRVRLRAPRGSRAFAAYELGSDVHIEVSIVSADDDILSDAVVSRVMETVGINVIEVGSFPGQQHADLGRAVSLVRDYLEACSIGLDPIECRHITDDQAGGLSIIHDVGEFNGLLTDWTCSNESIDAFVVQNFEWGDIEGRSGDEPGPEVKGGSDDGVVLKKWGYEVGGIHKLIVPLVGQLAGHEAGHYMGAGHFDVDDYLMHSFSVDRGSKITTDQCATMHDHGWVK